MQNKKTLILTIIGVAAFFILIVGATFAYFTSSEVNDGKTSVVTGAATPVGNIAISNPTDSLHIYLSILDMQKDNLGTYYATSDSTLNYDTEEIQREIASITLSGGAATTSYECSNTVNVEVSGTMLANLSKGDAYIQFGGLLTNKIDLTEISTSGYPVTFRLNGTDLLSQKITASIAIENRDANQNAIAGKELSVKFTNTSFNCKALGFTEQEMSSSNGTLAIGNSAEGNLNNYIIYGNSIQNGTPTPTSPVEVQSVGEKTNNLFDINAGFASNALYTATKIENNNIIIPASSGNSLSAEFNQYIPVNANETYTCKFELIQGLPRILIRMYDESKQIIDDSSMSITGFTYNAHYKGVFINASQAEVSFPSNVKYIRFVTVSMNNSEGVDNIYSNFQFVKGITNSDYEPYGYKIPITTKGKNLFDVEDAGSSAGWSAVTYKYYPIYVGDGNTVTISHKSTLNTGLNFYCVVGYKEEHKGVAKGAWLYHKTASDLIKTEVTVTPTGTDYIYLNCAGNMTAVDTYFLQDNLQVEYGSSKTNFASYVEPVTTNIYIDEPLRKVGNVKDYINFENGTIVRNIGEYKFDGSENWVTTGDVLANSYQGFAIESADYNVKILKTGTVLECLSDRFPYLSSSQTTTPNICRIISGQYGMRIIAGIDIVPNMTVSEFRSWLSAHNTTMLYPLETVAPETIELPDIPTFEGGSTIEFGTSVSPSNIDISYNARP